MEKVPLVGHEGVGPRRLVVSDSKFEHGEHPMRIGDPYPQATGARLIYHGRGYGPSVVLRPLPRRQEHIDGRRTEEFGIAGCYQDFGSFRVGCLTGCEASGDHIPLSEVIERNWQSRERPLISRKLDPPGGQRVPSFLVQELTCGPATESEPPQALICGKLVRAKRLDAFA